MEGKIVCKSDFADEEIEKMKSLSSFETLVDVAVKAYEKEKQKDQPVVGMNVINIPMLEKKPLPFDLNSKPRTNNRKPRSSPIDVISLLPCLHQKRKQDVVIVQECTTSGDTEFCSRNPKRIKANSGVEGLKQEEGCSSSSGVCVLSKGSKRVRLGGGVRIQLPPPRFLEPKLPLEFQQRITELGGSDVRFVIEKKLFKSDLSKSQSRLTMQMSKCKVDFGDVVEMRVKVIQPANNLKEMIMTFNKWTTVSSYVFTGSWNDLVVDNDLKIDDVVQVWSFRQDDELSFAVVVNKQTSSSS